MNDTALLCHRCGMLLKPGSGDFWIVRIDAVCDPTPPEVDTAASLESLAAEYEVLLAQAAGMSERELMDQVHRRLTMHMCTPCFREWIDEPAG